jgi:hypothetical protein
MLEKHENYQGAFNECLSPLQVRDPLPVATKKAMKGETLIFLPHPMHVKAPPPLYWSLVCFQSCQSLGVMSYLCLICSCLR